MTRLIRQHLTDLRGVARILVDATLGVTDLVEEMHRTIQQVPAPWARHSAGSRTRGITGFVYRRVNDTTRLVGAGLEATLGPVATWTEDGASSPARDAFVSALNGLYGDYLARTRNPLALDLSLRYEGEPLDIRDAERLCAALRERGRAPRLLVLVHGLCLNERHWMRKGHDHGAALAREMDFVPLYVRYNTGLPVSANGRVLARTLERLLQCLPVPVPEISILAHSMGGLVTRGALDQARRLRHAWPDRVRTCVFLGTPHHGAPLERAGHGLECILASSPYVVPFVRLSSSRSAGIRDLRHGTVGNARRFVPLPSGLRGYAIAATLDARQSAFGDRLLGDGLVPLDSALGRHSDLSRNLAFPPERQWIAPGVGHLDLLSDPAVYDRLRGWLD